MLQDESTYKKINNPNKYKETLNKIKKVDKGICKSPHEKGNRLYHKLRSSTK